MKIRLNGLIASFAVLAVIFVFMTTVFAFIFLSFKSTMQETEVVITPDTIEFKGIYGGKYAMGDVVEIILKDTLPTVLKKINGAGLKDIKKGCFHLEGIGECKLFVHNVKKGPFVYIKVNEQYIIINYKDQAKTEQLYNTLVSNTKIIDRG